jgi:hypothetical protein
MPQSCLPIQQVVGSISSVIGSCASTPVRSDGSGQSKTYLLSATVAAVAPVALINCRLVNLTAIVLSSYRHLGLILEWFGKTTPQLLETTPDYIISTVGEMTTGNKK